MFSSPLQLRKPGLFITGTDTEVGKTVATCAIAWNLRRQGAEEGRQRVAVCKPFASGCRKDREGLVSPDAEALAHFSDCRAPLEVINPLRYREPLAPGPAAEKSKQDVDFDAIATSLQRLDAEHDWMLIEGVGGLMVPLHPKRGKVTVLDLVRAVGYPVAVVTRPGLGTLNHTAMTVALLKQGGCKVAGLIVNGMPSDPAREADRSLESNLQWLRKMTGRPILAVLPRCDAGDVAPAEGRIAQPILEGAGQCYWPDVMRVPGG